MARYDTEAEVSTAIGVVVMGIAMGVIVAVVKLAWALMVWMVKVNREGSRPRLFHWAAGGSLAVLVLALLIGSGGLGLAGLFGLVSALLAISTGSGQDKLGPPEEITIEHLLADRWPDDAA
jgi:hypothetical protein